MQTFQLPKVFDSDTIPNLIKHTERELQQLFPTDPFLNDLPFDVSSEEVLSLIAVAQGRSIKVYIKRGDLPKFKIVVPHTTTTVRHLKKAIQRHFELDQRRRPKADDDLPSMALPPRPTHSREQSTTLVGQPSTSDRRRHQSSSDRPRDRDRKTSTAKQQRIVVEPTSQTRFGESTQHQRISWRYIWRTFHLDLDGVRLADDGKCIQDYGVTNKTVLRFSKKKQ